MKLLERTILSIIRRPLKTGIMILIIFVVSNIISGTLILYNSTQTIKEEIQSQIVPVVIFDTQQDLYDNIYNTEYINEYEVMLFEQSGWEYNSTEVMDIIKLFDEIASFDEVSYSDYVVMNPSILNEKAIFVGGLPANFYENYTQDHFLAYAGINKVDNMLFNNNIIEMVEGRMFTNEELENDIYKVLLPNNSKIVNLEGIKYNLQVGDTIKLTNRILDQERLLKEYNQNEPNYNEYTLKEILENKLYEGFNVWIDSITLYKEEYECEIIGFFDEYNKGQYDFGVSELGYGSRIYGIIPEKLLYQMKEDYDQASISLYKDKKIRQNNESEIYIFRNIFKLKNNDDIVSFNNKIDQLFKDSGLVIKKELSNDIYMKVAGPIEGINSISKFLLGIGIGVSIVVLACISILFMKERRNEIGILLAMGESKKHLMKQVLLEMLIICCIGNIGAMFTSKILSYQISEKMINESSYSIELSEEEKIMIDEDYTTTKVMNKYEKTLDSNNVALTCGISLVISLVSTSISVLWVFKMKPKEILL